MMVLRRLLRSCAGVSTVEFALAVPVILSLLIGMAQMGVLFAANAGLQHAVDEGARLATIYPRPTDDAITAQVLAKRFFVNSAGLVGPTYVHCTTATTNNGTAGSVPAVDISMRYTVPLNFVFFRAAPVTLSQTRRAYQQPLPQPPDPPPSPC